MTRTRWVGLCMEGGSVVCGGGCSVVWRCVDFLGSQCSLAWTCLSVCNQPTLLLAHMHRLPQVVGRVCGGEDLLAWLNSTPVDAQDAPRQRLRIARCGFTDAGGWVGVCGGACG